MSAHAGASTRKRGHWVTALTMIRVGIAESREGQELARHGHLSTGVAHVRSAQAAFLHPSGIELSVREEGFHSPRLCVLSSVMRSRASTSSQGRYRGTVAKILPATPRHVPLENSVQPA
jgi:hypothetical protein